MSSQRSTESGYPYHQAQPVPPAPAEPRRPHFLRTISLGLAIGVAYGMLAGMLVLQITQFRRIDGQLTELKARSEASRATGTDIGEPRDPRAAVGDPKAERVPLTNQEGEVLGEVVLLPDGKAYFVNSALPALSEAQTYQLWAIIEGDQKISAGLLGPRPSVEQLRINGPVKGFSITAENAGGVVQSQNQAVVRGFRKSSPSSPPN